MNRLATLSARLDNQFRQVTPARRLAAVLQVCAQAEGELGALEPDLAAALAALRAGGTVDEAALGALRDRLDDEYFALQDDDPGPPTPASLRAFSQARLAASLALSGAIGAPPTAADCLYEALMALNDAQVMVRTLELTLS